MPMTQKSVPTRGRWAARIVGLLGLIHLACTGSGDPLCDTCTTSSIIYGQVRYAGGGPIPGAAVTIEARRDKCSSADVPTGSESGLVAGPDGRYRTQLFAYARFTACPRVSVVPPGSALGPTVAEGPTVQFLPDFGANQQRDSVRVDVEVPLGAYQPTPARLVGEFLGDAGEGFQTYSLFLAIDEVTDSVRGLWSLSYTATCATHDGPFSGTLTSDELRLRLRPDEDYEATLDVVLRVVPGDSVLTGDPAVIAHGNVPGPPCGSDELAPITLHSGDVAGLPVGR
jgi:hypothetical protein